MTSHPAEQKARYRERQKQMELARQRGNAHVGDDAVRTAAINREAKLLKKKRQKSSLPG